MNTNYLKKVKKIWKVYVTQLMQIMIIMMVTSVTITISMMIKILLNQVVVFLKIVSFSRNQLLVIKLGKVYLESKKLDEYNLLVI